MEVKRKLISLDYEQVTELTNEKHVEHGSVGVKWHRHWPLSLLFLFSQISIWGHTERSKQNFSNCCFSRISSRFPVNLVSKHDELVFHLFLIYLSRHTIFNNILPLPRLFFLLPFLECLVLCKSVQFRHSQDSIRTVLIKIIETLPLGKYFFSSC